MWLGLGTVACGGQAPAAETPAPAEPAPPASEEQPDTAPAATTEEATSGGAAPAEGAASGETPASGPGGLVEIAPPRITGKLSGDDSVERVISGTRAGLTTCYERGLREQPGAAGEVVFKIAVSDSGAILKVSSTNPPGLPGSVTACMVGRFGALSFKAAGASTIEVGVTCKPSP